VGETELTIFWRCECGNMELYI